MKITAFDGAYPARLATGDTWLDFSAGSNTAEGNISGAGDVVGDPGDYTVVGLRRVVSLASNMGGSTIGDVLTIIQANPRLATFATPSNTGASAGSNSTRVSETAGAGVAATFSPSDHRHDGIGTITASSSNTMQRGTLNLRAGSNVAFGLTDTDGDGEFDTLTIGASAAGGGGSGLTIEEVDGSPTATATKLVLPNGTLSYAGTVATYTPAAAAGGALYPLDDRTLHATYGDHFTAASLDAKWTRRNYTSGAETYQRGVDATFLRISASGRANGDGYFQTAPAGDFSAEMKYVPRMYGAQYPNWGPAIIDSSGNGVAVIVYNGPPIAVILIKVTTYSTYASAYVQAGGGGDNITQLGATIPQERALWLRVRKSSDNYYCSYSLDGEGWGLESNALAYTFTVDRTGMMHGPLGNAVISATIPNRMDVDWFDVV